MTDNKKETVDVKDSAGFIYRVDVVHSPHFGFSTAYHLGSVIDQCSLGRILPPLGDDDREWEMYEERFAEWRDEVLMNLKIACRLHFDMHNP